MKTRPTTTIMLLMMLLLMMKRRKRRRTTRVRMTSPILDNYVVTWLASVFTPIAVVFRAV